MGPGRSQFSWVAAALTPPSNFEAISSRFRAILGDFGQFWAVLNDFALVLSAFQLRRVSARGEGQGMGQPAQQVLEYLLVWLGPASIGEIYGIFSLSLIRVRFKSDKRYQYEITFVGVAFESREWSAL